MPSLEAPITGSFFSQCNPRELLSLFTEKDHSFFLFRPQLRLTFRIVITGQPDGAASRGAPFTGFCKVLVETIRLTQEMIFCFFPIEIQPSFKNLVGKRYYADGSGLFPASQEPLTPAFILVYVQTTEGATLAPPHRAGLCDRPLLL